MAKNCVILLLLLSLTPLISEAQTTGSVELDGDAENYPIYKECPQVPNQVYKTNPAAILWGSIPFTAEYRFLNEITIGQHTSAEFGISYLGKSPILRSLEDSMNVNSQYPVKFKVSGLRFQMAYRYYLNDLFPNIQYTTNSFSPQGYYVALHFSYSTAKFSNRYLSNYDIYLQGSHTNLNFLLGRQFWLTKRLSFDCFGGLGYKRNDWIINDATTNSQQNLTDDFPDFYKGNLKISLGFNFGIGF